MALALKDPIFRTLSPKYLHSFSSDTSPEDPRDSSGLCMDVRHSQIWVPPLALNTLDSTPFTMAFNQKEKGGKLKTNLTPAEWKYSNKCNNLCTCETEKPNLKSAGQQFDFWKAITLINFAKFICNIVTPLNPFWIRK